MRILSLIPLLAIPSTAEDPVSVLVWDERQPRQAQAYDRFLGNEIATRLGASPGLAVVSSVRQDDPGYGLGTLDEQDVLVWRGTFGKERAPTQSGRGWSNEFARASWR